MGYALLITAIGIAISVCIRNIAAQDTLKQTMPQNNRPIMKIITEVNELMGNPSHGSCLKNL